ncbi:hypothetical protein Cni_G11648 [Canna indica]|uniref:BHLH domain-containing protein n=1 Tax=Canna indica TaxID=4628 RepID=A0AAQ3K862_9LILI|nr:hypothetical protein Cni_G11648 [Canna indica]
MMMQCVETTTPLSDHDLSVLERQRARMGWLQSAAYDHGDYCSVQPSFHGCDGHRKNETAHGSLHCFSNGWPDLGTIQYPVPGAAATVIEETTSVTVSNSSSRKRKPPEKSKQGKGRVDSNCKRIKEETGATSESKQENNGKEASGDTSKENDKPPKTDYIHVRARRGQATDSHSLAERVRRERISQRMKYLQDLVPGCSKITGKAGMLDEIINYVQSLQRQVEFLSMKLAAVNPMMDINVESFFGKDQVNQACKSVSIPTTGISSEMLDQQPYLQFNSLQAHPACSGLDMFMDYSSDLVLRQTASGEPVALPDTTSLSGSCLNINGSTVWNTSNLQNFYGVEFQLGRESTAFPFQSLQGNVLPNNLKMEM